MIWAIVTILFLSSVSFVITTEELKDQQIETDAQANFQEGIPNKIDPNILSRSFQNQIEPTPTKPEPTPESTPTKPEPTPESTPTKPDAIVPIPLSPQPTEKKSPSTSSGSGGLDLLNYIAHYSQESIEDSEWWEENTFIAIAKLHTNFDTNGANAWLEQVTDAHGTNKNGSISEKTFPHPNNETNNGSHDWDFVNTFIIRAYFQFKDNDKLTSKARINMRNVLAYRAGYPTFSYGENHNAMMHSAGYFGNVIIGGNRTENIKWLSNFLDNKIRYGYTELNSPTYMGAEWRVLWNLYDFAVDPILKNKAKAVLDMLLAEMAVVNVAGMRGGPFSRYYGAKIVNQADDYFYGIAHSYFGTPLREKRLYRIFPWFSSYEVPSIIQRIAYADKEPFVLKSKRYLRGKIVSTYYYVTKHSVLATVQGDFPDSELMSTNTGQRGHNWDILFDTSIHKVIFSGSTDGENRYNESDAVQSNNVLITSPNTQINYIGVKRVSESGWYFVQEGKTFVAIKRLSNGRTLIEVRCVDDYGKSFNEFKAQVKSSYLSVQSGSEDVTYINTYGETIISPTHYTVSNDSFSYKLFDSPYLQSEWGSGQITVIYENKTYVITY